MSNDNPNNSDEPEQGSVWMNIGKIVFLVVVLVVAWFILEWLIGSK